MSIKQGRWFQYLRNLFDEVLSTTSTLRARNGERDEVQEELAVKDTEYSVQRTLSAAGNELKRMWKKDPRLVLNNIIKKN